jgi:hypothetical protein
MLIDISAPNTLNIQKSTPEKTFAEEIQNVWQQDKVTIVKFTISSTVVFQRTSIKAQNVCN